MRIYTLSRPSGMRIHLSARPRTVVGWQGRPLLDLEGVSAVHTLALVRFQSILKYRFAVCVLARQIWGEVATRYFNSVLGFVHDSSFSRLAKKNQ